MTPLERYRAELAAGALVPDPVQERVVAHLQRLYDELTAPRGRGVSPGLLARLRVRYAAPVRRPVRGLYLWGGVGRGKTHLVNAFFEALPFEEKLRVHFHRFMHYVHGELKGLGQREDPLRAVARDLGESTRVLCLDEFHVSDITDAMLLGRLLASLFEAGVVLVATSNQPPDQLYRGGLQRERFLAAIALLEQATEVVHLDGDADFRLRALERAEIYHYPLDAGAHVSLLAAFEQLCPEQVREGEAIEVNGRPVETVRTAEGIAWFEFRELCETARSAADYIEIARCFHTVFVSSIPRMGSEDADKARRFIHLVDELYDRNVNLIASAEAPPAELYDGERLAFEFRRAASRLREMQSREYLSRLHLP